MLPACISRFTAKKHEGGRERQREMKSCIPRKPKHYHYWITRGPTHDLTSPYPRYLFLTSIPGCGGAKLAGGRWHAKVGISIDDFFSSSAVFVLHGIDATGENRTACPRRRPCLERCEHGPSRGLCYTSNLNSLKPLNQLHRAY